MNLTQSALNGSKLRTADETSALEAVQITIERAVREFCWGPLEQISAEHLCNSGRLFRARIALDGGERLGLPWETSVAFAAACELVHNASLVHDDIQDQHTMRRGRPALWTTHGLEQAVTAGDLMLMLPFLALDLGSYDHTAKWRLCRSIAQRAANTACGQATEFEMLTRRQLTRNEYERAAQGKTGQLFAMPIEGVAILGKRHNAQDMGDATLALGTLFQLQDDVVDLYGDKARGAAGDDLRDGKVTALVVAHLELCPNDKDALLAMLDKPRDLTDEESVRYWTQRFVESGALKNVAQWGAQLVNAMSVDHRLDQAPELRDYLVSAGHQLLERIYIACRQFNIVNTKSS